MKEKKSKKSSKRYTIGIDIGGTKILTGLFDRKFRLLAAQKTGIDASRNRRFFLRALEDSVRSVLAGLGLKLSSVDAIGAGCPAMIRPGSGVVTLAPNLSLLNEYPLQAKLRGRFGVPGFIENEVGAGL